MQIPGQICVQFNSYTKERKRQLSIEEIIKLRSVLNTTAQDYADAPVKYGAERL